MIAFSVSCHFNDVDTILSTLFYLLNSTILFSNAIDTHPAVNYQTEKLLYQREEYIQIGRGTIKRYYRSLSKSCK